MEQRAVPSVLVVMLAGLLTGCSSVDVEEHTFTLLVETRPSGATLYTGDGTTPLGVSPFRVESLTVSMKTYISDSTDYWLSDPSGKLPPNPSKPLYASPKHLAGNEYPYVLQLVASFEGGRKAREDLVFNRARLEELLNKRTPEIKIVLDEPGRPGANK